MIQLELFPAEALPEPRPLSPDDERVLSERYPTNVCDRCSRRFCVGTSAALCHRCQVAAGEV